MDNKKIIHNIGWLFFDRVFRMGVGLFVGVWFARYLGPQLFGKFNYATAVVALFGSFSTLGMDGILIKRIINNPGKINSYMGTAFVMRQVGSLIAMLSAIVFSYCINGHDQIFISSVLIISFSLFFQAFDVIDLYYQAEVNSKKSVTVKNLAFFITTVLKVISILTHASFFYFIFLTLIEIFIGGVGLLFQYGIKTAKNWTIDINIAFSLLRESLPSILSGVVVMVYMRIDQIMIGKFIGDRTVGIYSAAVKIAEVWYFLPIIITNSIYPQLLKLRFSNEQAYQRKCLVLNAYMVLISIPISLIVAVFSHRIIHLLYGSSFDAASGILSVSIWAGVFVFWGVAAGNLLIIDNLNRHSFIKALLGAILNIVLNLRFIPQYGAIGAAYATLISQLFASSLYFMIFKRTRFIFFLQMKALFNPLIVFKKNVSV